MNLKVALTIDDLFMWPGVPFPESTGPQQVSKQLTQAFARHRLKSVYAFSCTKPAEGTRAFDATLDAWCAAGHAVGGHSHAHCSLNWTSIDKYLADIDHAHVAIARYLESAPTRYFRFPFDMWGDSAEKTASVLVHLAKAGFAYAPISMWFYDAQFAVPHIRALATGDEEALRRVESLFVESTIQQFRNQAAGARAAMGRDPVHIALLHGTPIVGATIERILDGLTAEGVTFVTLEDAMRDAFNVIVPPLTTRSFRNWTQKWAEVTNVAVPDMPPAILHDLAAIAPVPGYDEATLFVNAFNEMAKAAYGVAKPDDFYL